MMGKTQNKIGDARLEELRNVLSYAASDAEEIRSMVRELAFLRASQKRLVDVLGAIYTQVTNGRLCYFGDHTRYEPQFSSAQVRLWEAAFAEARKLEAIE